MKIKYLSPAVKEMVDRVGKYRKNGAIIRLFVANTKDIEAIAHDFNLAERISEGDTRLGIITINSFNGM